MNVLTIQKNPKCILCNSQSSFLVLYRKIEYYSCKNCSGIFMSPFFHPSKDRERARYEQHNNDVNDPRYRNFVKPLVDEVTENFNNNTSGLDYGAGTGPVAAKMLEEGGFNLELYDPFFHNRPALLTKKYDFIIASEVIEHFHTPADEFKMLRSLLKPEGSLICMTQLFKNDTDFLQWQYKDDETHVFFYHINSLDWIKIEYNFTSLNVKNRIIHFRI